jgi:hypothetical protein
MLRQQRPHRGTIALFGGVRERRRRMRRGAGRNQQHDQ